MSRGAAEPVARIEDNLADVKALFKAKIAGLEAAGKDQAVGLRSELAGARAASLTLAL